jgi:hypothetical protein
MDIKPIGGITMETEMVEIKPGVFIEITARHKKKAGIARKVKIRRSILSAEGHAEALNDVGRLVANKHIKYSKFLLDEAVELQKLRGFKYAVKKTGVKYWSIMGHKRRIGRANGKVTSDNHWNSRYTMAQKKACVKLALSLMQSGETKQTTILYPSTGRKLVRTEPKWPITKAFIEAGRRLGMNGNSIHFQWTEGSIK